MTLQIQVNKTWISSSTSEWKMLTQRDWMNRLLRDGLRMPPWLRISNLRLDKCSFTGRFSFMVIIFNLLAFMLLPKIVCKVPVLKCPRTQPTTIIHKYYQPGDRIIGGILSQSFIFINAMMFRRPPHSRKYFWIICKHFKLTNDFFLCLLSYISILHCSHTYRITPY